MPRKRSGHSVPRVIARLTPTLYAQRMSTPTEQDMGPVERAIAGEVRACIARAKLSQKQIYEQLGWSQSYFNRRYNGHTPWSSGELLKVMNAIDEDITRVYAAGALALAAEAKKNKRKARKTYPCLSDSELAVGESLRGRWSARGLAMGSKLFPHLVFGARIDGTASAA